MVRGPVSGPAMQEERVSSVSGAGGAEYNPFGAWFASRTTTASSRALIVPDLMELEQEDLRDIDFVADAFLRVTSSLDPGASPSGLPNGFGQQFARLAEDVVALALNFGARLRPRREEYRRAGWAGRAEQIHVRRGGLLRSFESRLRHLAQAVRIASVAEVLTGRDVPGSERLPEAILDLEALKEEVFARWHTLEDLQEMLVETYPFTAEQFDAIATQHRPPQEWYEQVEQAY